MKIAIITGASAGLGRKLLEKSISAFPNIDEYWLIARNRDKLEDVASEYPDKKFRLLALDLCNADSFTVLSNELENVNPEVFLLINNAGCGYLKGIGIFLSCFGEYLTGFLHNKLYGTAAKKHFFVFRVIFRKFSQLIPIIIEISE